MKWCLTLWVLAVVLLGGGANASRAQDDGNSYGSEGSGLPCVFMFWREAPPTDPLYDRGNLTLLWDTTGDEGSAYAIHVDDDEASRLGVVFVAAVHGQERQSLLHARVAVGQLVRWPHLFDGQGDFRPSPLAAAVPLGLRGGSGERGGLGGGATTFTELNTVRRKAAFSGTSVSPAPWLAAGKPTIDPGRRHAPAGWLASGVFLMGKEGRRGDEATVPCGGSSAPRAFVGMAPVPGQVNSHGTIGSYIFTGSRSGSGKPGLSSTPF